MMKTFHYNIINRHGKKGKTWLNELPQLVTEISSKLNLHTLQEITNLTHNYVLSGFQGNTPIILKLSPDRESLAQEAWSLMCFADYGAIKVLFKDDGMLLLERAVPGTSLKSYFPNDEKKSIDIASGIMKKLSQANISAPCSTPHIRDWLTALDTNCCIPDGYLQKARKLRDQLLQNSMPDILLHGDLHHDNILQNGSDWLIIDPKGVIGEPAYEVAAFIRNPIPKLLTRSDTPHIIDNRITRFAHILDLPGKRIFDWCFVQATLAWIWALEDNCDARYFECLVQVFASRQT